MGGTLLQLLTGSWVGGRGEMCKQSELSTELAEFKCLHVIFLLPIELCGAI